MKRIFFVTGTDTGVGKTVLTVLLVNHLCAHGVKAAGLKPVCSGGRGDARKIYAVMDGALSLDEINPWHFHRAIAPLLAARIEKKKVKLEEVATYVRTIQERFDVLLVEGVGGLLSPMGDTFNSRDLILELRATPIVVAPNRLGVVNQVLLTLEALPAKFRSRAIVVLMPCRKPDISAKSNGLLLSGFFDAKRILTTGTPGFVLRLSGRIYAADREIAA